MPTHRNLHRNPFQHPLRRRLHALLTGTVSVIILAIASIRPASAQDTLSSAIQDLPVYRYEELPAARVVGKTRLKKLDSRGVRIPGGVAEFSAATLNRCLGTFIECKKPFNVLNFQFTVWESQADRAVLELVFLRILEDGSQEEMLESPLLFSLDAESHREEYRISLDTPILLEPGSYFAGIRLREIKGGQQKLYFPLYSKKSILQDSFGQWSESSFNIGLSITGK